jgi:hypothetical protein
MPLRCESPDVVDDHRRRDTGHAKAPASLRVLGTLSNDHGPAFRPAQSLQPPLEVLPQPEPSSQLQKGRPGFVFFIVRPLFVELRTSSREDRNPNRYG